MFLTPRNVESHFRSALVLLLGGVPDARPRFGLAIKKREEHTFARPPAQRGIHDRLNRLETDPQQSQSRKGQAIKFGSKILFQGILKDLVLGCGMGEQSHRRSKLQIIRIAKNLVD